MPLVAPALTATIATTLLGSGMLGPAMPKLASGLGQGLTLWVRKLKVVTVDAGAVGTGKGLFPFLIPQPILMGALLVAYASNGHLGPMAPLEAVGLANGITIGLAQGFLNTTHPSVGAGAAVAKISGPSAFSSIMQGFASAGITGQGASAKANAISLALTVVLQTLVLPVPIVGAAGPSASSGSGFGSVL
jgi:hypothetical protein